MNMIVGGSERSQTRRWSSFPASSVDSGRRKPLRLSDARYAAERFGSMSRGDRSPGRLEGQLTMPTRRRERNQQLFREVNRRISDVNATFDATAADDELDFVCECADASCTEMVPLSLSEYQRVPRAGNYFLVKVGHQASHQRIVVRATDYVVVEEPAVDGTTAAVSHQESRKVANVSD